MALILMLMTIQGPLLATPYSLGCPSSS